MNRRNFTKAYLESIPPPKSSSRSYVYDTKVFGLCLSVTKAGTKSFLVYRKLKGNPIRVTLGRFPNLTVEQARKLALRTLGDIAEGNNPIEKKRAQKQRGTTLTEVFADYMSSRATKHSANTKANYKTIMSTHLADWATKPMVEITRDKVEAKHLKLSKYSPSSANKSMRVLRALFNYANGKYEDESGRGLFPDNPVTRLTSNRSWNTETRRQGVIRAAEMEAWFHAISQLRKNGTDYDETVSDYLVFVLMNGLRRREAAFLAKENVDIRTRTFTIHKTKNRQPITLPMSSFTKDLLLKRMELVEGKYLFPTEISNKKSGPLNDPRRQIAKIRSESDVFFTTHDLRRTFITIAESLDISVFAVKALVNHSVGRDVTAGYIIMDVERLREPMQRITDLILRSAKISAVSATATMHKDEKQKA